MKKLRTKATFNTYLDHEITWHIKEIADMRDAIKSAELTAQKSIIRAGIPILYAHWEGFIKKTSEALIVYINNQGLAYKELKSCYIVFGTRRMIAEIRESGNTNHGIKIVEFFLTQMVDRAKLGTGIRTEFNLTSVVFDRIATSVGIDTAPYETKYPLIDVSLLKRRNDIAHGEYLDVNDVDFRSLSQEVISLMRRYKDDVSNIVSTDAFKRP